MIWRASRIMEAGLASSVEDALRQDWPLCRDIINAREYVAVYRAESDKNVKVPADLFKWMIQLERAAGA